MIDSIRDEGEYQIKLRTYDENGESDDSNIVVARFRRQNAVAPQSNSKMIQRTQSDHIVDDMSQGKLRQTQSQENLVTQPIIMNKQHERMEVNQSMSSGGFPLLTQLQQQMDIPTTPDQNKVNQNNP